MKKIISSESVTPGHPDKMCDVVSDSILDAILSKDSEARVACETAAKTGNIFILGEITTNANIEIPDVVRAAIKKIGYKAEFGLDPDTCGILVGVTRQSNDISQGVTEGQGDFKEQGAGDQGMMYGFATNETPELMPLPIILAHKLTKRLTEVRETGLLNYLGPDGKSQVAVRYHEGKPVSLENVIIASQHKEYVDMNKLREEIRDYVILPVCEQYLTKETEFFINATGRFVLGGPVADAGLTGRKIIVDTYGGVGRHGGGAFCLAGDSLVNTERGLVKINNCKEIGEQGLLVKTDVHPMPAGAWFDNGLKPTEIIITSDGFNVEATLNHNIRILDKNGNYAWKPVGTLAAGDWICIQTKNRFFGNDEIPEFKFHYKHGTAEGRKKKYPFPTMLTEDYASLLGLLIGDGDCTDEGCIKICICEKEMKKIVQKLFKKLFSDKGRVYGHWNYIGGVELRAFLKHLGLDYSKSYEKAVPKTIFNASKKNCAAFLRGLFDTDGSIRMDGRNKNTKRIHLATTSKKLAEQIQLLLLNFGIVSTIQSVTVTEKKAFIKGRKINSAHVRYDVTIRGSKSVKIFTENIGFGLTRKQKILSKIVPNKRDLRNIPNQKQRIISLFKKLPKEEQRKDVCQIGRFTRCSKGKATKELTYEKAEEFIHAYEKFLKDEPEFQRLQELFFMAHYFSPLKTKLPSFAHTYDLNIPFSHTFTANGIVCHNSGKDPTKVDRSGAYAARYIAKNVVAAGLADKCEVQLAYVIGKAEPTSIYVETFGTNKVEEDKIASMVREVFPTKPADILRELKLRRPIYAKTAAFGHFGRNEPDFTWEKTDQAEQLKKALLGE